MIIGSLGVKLGLIIEDWDKKMAAAKDQTKRLKSSLSDLVGGVDKLNGQFKGMAGALGLIGFGSMLRSTITFADEISDMGKGFGISTGKILQFTDALEQSGGSAAGASKALSTLFDKIDAAKSGNEAMISQFEKLGISFDDLQKYTPEQSLNAVANGLAHISDKVTQAARVKDFFGKSGVGVDIQNLNDLVQKSTSTYNTNAAAIDNMAQVNDNLARTARNAKIALAELLSPFAGKNDALVGVDTFKAAIVALFSAATILKMWEFVKVMKEIYLAIRASALAAAMLNLLGGWAGVAKIGAAVAGTYALKEAIEKMNGSMAETGETAKDSFSGLADQMKNAASAQATFLSGMKGTVGNMGMKPVDMSAFGKGTQPINTFGQTNKPKEEKVDASRPEAIANAAKLKAAQDAVGFAKEEARLKLDALTSDEQAIEIRKADLALKEQISQLDAQKAQDLQKENLSAMQIKSINDVYNQNVAKANAEHAGAIQVIKKQSELAHEAKLRELDVINQQSDIENKRAQLELDRPHLTEIQIRLREIEIDRQEKINALLAKRKEIEDTMGSGRAKNDALANIDAQISAQNKLSDNEMNLANQNEASRKSFSDGWDQAFKNYQSTAENAAQVGADVFNTATGNMADALISWAQGGKLTFKDFANSMIADIMRIIIKWQLMNLISMAMGKGGISFGSMFGGHAYGGNVEGGKPIVVGENGPELFVPQRGGAVVPNQRMQDYSQPAPQTVFNGPYIASMNAIDTQSGVAFLAKNKQAIWAANQSAQRSVPASR